MAKGRTQEVALNIPGLSADDTGAPAGGFILVVEGLEATGKSRLACQAPGPIAYFSIDAGADRVVETARADGKRIYLGSYEYAVPKFVLAKDSEWWEKQGDRINETVWQPFMAAWDAAVAHPKVRAVVMDTATEFWELCRLASFGKLQQNPQLAYGPVNAEYLGLLKSVKKAGKVAVLLHQTAQAYERYMDDKTGKEKSRERPGVFERKGMNKVGFVADAIVRTHYVEGETRNEKDKLGRLVKVPLPARWETEIIRAKSNMGANGQRFETVDFATLMGVYLKPESDAALWEE